MSIERHSTGDSGGAAGEHRAHARQRVLKSGRILLKGHTSTIDVLIRDLSATGVKLKLANPWIVPDRFDLTIANPATGTSETHACEKRWQRGLMAGARFIDPDAPKPA
ncbi:MAG: PilZ domain-containing protein [Hyphomonas sp.]|nr:PilZ domain-containing protein [Hyphomonas sp.]